MGFITIRMKVEMYQINTLYTLNLYDAICQLYLNKNFSNKFFFQNIVQIGAYETTAHITDNKYFLHTSLSFGHI